MAAFNAIVLIAALSQINQASGNEASSISAESVYKKVRLRVRDIVSMLQNMQEQVTKDGEEDAELFGKYMFYCRRGRAAMEASIEEAEKTDLDELKSTIESEEETRKEMENEVAEEQAKKADAEKAIAKAKTLREYEATVFAEESSKLRKDIATMKRAMSAVGKGEALPTAAGSLLKQLSGSGDVKKKDRELLASFLQQLHGGDSMPKNSETKSVLEHMVDTLQKRLSDVIAEEQAEKSAFQDYKDMIRKKANGIKAEIEQKAAEVEELDAEVVSQKDTLEDAARYLMEGPAFLPFISDSENCTQKEDEWADRCQIRTAEMVAIADTITILTDEALLDELWQNSLPKPWQEATHHAILASKQSNQSRKPAFDLMSLAIKGKNVSFTKIFNVIDGMVAMLGKEKLNTNHEKYCGQSINQTEDNLNRLTITVSDLGTVIARHEKSIATLTSEIDDVRAGIEKLDREIVEAAMVRKQEHEANAELLTSDNMTVNLYRSARNRLDEFYSQELPTSNISGVSLAEIIGPYQKKREDCKNIMSMLDATLSELGSEIVKVETKENTDQDTWEKVVRDSLEKHASDMKSISEKQGTKAHLEESLVTIGKEKAEKLQEVKATTKYLSELRGNNTGFLRPSVCARKSKSSKNIEPPFPKNIVLW